MQQENCFVFQRAGSLAVHIFQGKPVSSGEVRDRERGNRKMKGGRAWCDPAEEHWSINDT
jgi:hypothetical protein